MILVTGVTGHLGGVVARRLLGAGRPVLGVGRDERKLAALSPSLRTYACDLSHEESVVALAQRFPEVTEVVHLAARIRTGTPQQYYADNLEATILLARHFGPQLRTYVYMSSFDVYSIPLPAPIAEDAPTQPSTLYGASKLAGEKYLQVWGGARLPILRCSSVYGPGQTIARAMSSFLARARRHEPLHVHGGGEDLRDYVHVEDVARAVESCLDRGDGVLNLGGGRPVSIRELAETAIAVTGSRSQIVESPRQKPGYDLVLDISRLRALGFEPQVSLEAGMRSEAESILS